VKIVIEMLTWFFMCSF